MIRVGIPLLASVLFLLCGGGRGLAAEPPAPEFQEVYSLIRGHLAGINESNLNHTAVDALVAALSPRVSLVGPGNSALEITGGPLVKSSNVFEGSVAYLRISRVEDGLAKAVREAYENIGTSHLNGIVLDLRYTGGEDYGAAAATADLFVSRERPLLNWGDGVVKAKEKSDAISLPVAVLVNGQTARAAEALAAALREAGVAVILGAKTAGQAMIAQEFPLKNGQRLRIATASIQVGDSLLLSSGIKPDIAVEVSPANERAYFADAYKEFSQTNLLAAGNTGMQSATNGTRRARFNEAELVRQRREGVADFDPTAMRGDDEPEKPVVRDPALARALDLLKGLAVVRRTP